MIKNCKYFKCANTEECEVFKEGRCSGSGSDGYHNCGCDVCFEQHMEGDMEVCEVGLMMREEDMEDRPSSR